MKLSRRRYELGSPSHGKSCSRQVSLVISEELKIPHRVRSFGEKAFAVGAEHCASLAIPLEVPDTCALSPPPAKQPALPPFVPARQEEPCARDAAFKEELRASLSVACDVLHMLHDSDTCAPDAAHGEDEA